MQAVPLGFFLFLAELAAGGMIVTTILDWDGEVSEGFLFLNGGFLLAFLGLGIWLRSVLPAERLVEWPVAARWVELEVIAWAGFAFLAAVQLALIRMERRGAGRVVGTIASVGAVGTTALSSASYASPAGGGVGLFLALLAGALALGTVWSGMMLGHWYLVTPLLAPRPLLRLNAAMALCLVAQAVLAAWALASGGFAEGVAWLYWLRVVVGIAFPLLLAVPVWRTARVRSMMSATGLLYVALGTVLSGEIIAKALFFVTGTPT